MNRDGTEPNSENASMTGEGGARGDLVVPSSHVETFLATLKSYSDSCEASRASVEETVNAVERLHQGAVDLVAQCTAMKSSTETTVSKARNLTKQVEQAAKKGREDTDALGKEREVLEALGRRAIEQFKKFRQVQSRVDITETYICDFVDVVRESENVTRQQYTRTKIASTLCKEITKAGNARGVFIHQSPCSLPF